jgi:hypothetical protein
MSRFVLRGMINMAAQNIRVFFSAGGPSTEAQKLFISRLKEILQSENIIPVSAPFADRIEDTLKRIEETMNECSGALILAFERVYVEAGEEFRSGQLPNRMPRKLNGVKVTTVWNQIEAALAELRGIPMLIMFEDGLRVDGFLEHNTWRPLPVNLDPAQLNTEEFRQRLLSWKARIEEFQRRKPATKIRRSRLTPTWVILLVLAALALGASAGAWFGYSEGSRIFSTPERP